MSENVIKLSREQITSEIFIVSPKQIDIISKIFAYKVAEQLNMKLFTKKIEEIAQNSIKYALKQARFDKQ